MFVVQKLLGLDPWVFFFFFFGSILFCSQSYDHPLEDLAKFGYK